MSYSFHPFAYFFVLLVLYSLPTQTAARQNLCLLCEDGNAGLKYPNAVIKSDGTTCASMAVQTAINFEEDSESCIEHLQAWRPICCGDNKPLEVEVTDVFDTYPDIDSIEKTGKYNKCDLCRDGDYPSSESMVINMLYVGEGSCPQYWKAGQQGLIPNHLCAPLQYFAYEPCGCGEYSTNGNYNWGDSYDGVTPSDDDEDAWWNSADGNKPSNEDDDKPWWASANGNHGSTDDEAPWWESANGSSGASHGTSFVAVVIMALTVLL